jgi:hypothetical protein
MFLNKNLAARRIFAVLYEDSNKVPVQHSKIGTSKRYGAILDGLAVACKGQTPRTMPTNGKKCLL